MTKKFFPIKTYLVWFKMEERRGKRANKKLTLTGSKQKRGLSVEEVVQEELRLKEERKTKKKRTPLTTFVPVTSGTFKWLGSGDLGGVVNLRRGSTKQQIFLKLAPPTVVEEMIKERYEMRKKGEHEITVKDIYEYWAVRIFMHGERLPKFLDNWSKEYDMKRRLPMGKQRYKRLQKVWLCPSAVKKLNEASQALIRVPEVVDIDEKLQPFSGITPYLRYIPNKDPPNGHLIVETTLKGSSTQLPFLLNSYPVQQHDGPTMLEFFQAALGHLNEEEKQEVVVIADAYYIDEASRKWLRENGIKYLLAVNPTRFAEVWVGLRCEAQEIGAWVIGWSEETEEAALYHWHEKLGEIYLLTNAFSYVDDGKDLHEPIFERYYKHTFNITDKLNHHLHGKGYPYHRPKWMYNFDNFHFTSLLWNSYVLYHECHPNVPRMEWREYCVSLYSELWAWTTKQ